MRRPANKAAANRGYWDNKGSGVLFVYGRVFIGYVYIYLFIFIIK